MTKKFSRLMALSLSVFSEKFAWRLRRFYVPVSKDALVLEVGSGGNPYGRSNVLLDSYIETRERHYAKLVNDRPTVIGFGENLPFKDDAFDFLIAAHVLEHSTDPEKFLSEMQRVSKAGYIEVPDAFMERLNPYKDHRLEVTVRDNKLLITKKSWWQHDPELVELYEAQVKKYVTRELMPRHPFAFHTRYFWSGKIEFEIRNPAVDCGWPPVEDESHDVAGRQQSSPVRDLLLSLTRLLTSQSSRNATLNIQHLLQCPKCRAGGLNLVGSAQVCDSCGATFKIVEGMPILTE